MPTRTQLVLFFLINTLLCAWHLDHARNDNSASRAATVAALVGEGSLCIDRYAEGLGDKAVINGHAYSDKAPLPAFLVAPIYSVLVQTGLAQAVDGSLLTGGLLRIGGLLCASLPLALIITLLWWHVLKNGKQKLPAFLLSALPIYGSFLFVYSGTFYSHVLGAMLVLLGYRSLTKQRGFEAGLFCGAAVLTEYTLAIFPVFWLVRSFIVKDQRIAIGMIKGGLLPAALLLGYNTLTTRSPLDFAYRHVPEYAFMQEGMGLGLPSIKALWGLTFSPYRGLFIYAPAVLIVLTHWLRTEQAKSFLKDPVLPLVLIHFLVIAGYTMWWGGWAFGPRHLAASTVLLLYAGIPKVARNTKWSNALVVASAIGFVFALATKSTLWYDLPTDITSPLTSLIMPNLMTGDFSDRFWVIDTLMMSKKLAAALFVPLFIVGCFGMYALERKVPDHLPETR
ncbi:MAG: hypothetical protein KA408_05200 [Flavobacteriales bacterium]|nr:hypothetical protein [Flavobacteriales bacterium]